MTVLLHMEWSRVALLPPYPADTLPLRAAAAPPAAPRRAARASAESAALGTPALAHALLAAHGRLVHRLRALRVAEQRRHALLRRVAQRRGRAFELFLAAHPAALDAHASRLERRVRLSSLSRSLRPRGELARANTRELARAISRARWF